jgi:mono/diheme cytochrome c family protein
MDGRRKYSVAALAALCLVSALCFGTVVGASAQMTMRGTAQEGRRLFHSSALSTNGLACIHCHADFDEARLGDGLIRAGHPLVNAAGRQTWWGQEVDDPDRYPDIAHAAVVCVQIFMKNPQKLTAQQLLSLQAYLRGITRRPVKAPLALSPAADKTGQYAGFEGGDRIAGRELFFAACHTCHPNGNDGIAPVAIPRDKPASFYARKIREGNGLGSTLAGVDPNAFDPEGETYMPFFGADRLTNQQIRHIIAYIKSLPTKK